LPKREPGFEVVGEAEDGHSTLAPEPVPALDLRPGFVPMDIKTPLCDGLLATENRTSG
jgi:DNA-binding NarL/FixJ family response regulator